MREQCSLCGANNEAGTLVCGECGSNLRQAAVLADLRERITQLEQQMATLQGHADQPPQNTPTEAPESPQENTPEPSDDVASEDVASEDVVPEPERASILPETIWQSDFWLNKVGIALLLLALAFLFNYAVEQGWLTPAVRVAMGLLLGTGLLGVGYWLGEKRPSFSQVLSGGGIAAYYISGFAAFQLYDLVPYLAAFAFMVLVTLFAFFISLRQNEAMLALVGGLGGLATPLLLDNGTGSILGLLIYTTLLVGGLTLIYYFRGWQLVHWLANMGGWLIVIAGMLGENVSGVATASQESITVQSAIIVLLLAFWAVPILRQLHHDHWEGMLPPAQLGVADWLIGPRLRAVFNSHIYVSTLTNPLIAWLLTMSLWDMEDINRGWLTLLTAVFFGGIAYLLRQMAPTVAYMQALVGLIFLTIATLLLLEDNWLFLSWVFLVVVIHLAASWVMRRSLSWIGHVYGLVVAIWLLTRLLDGVGRTETAVWNWTAATDLVALLALFAATFALTSLRSRSIYRVIIHIFFLLLLWRELSELSGGQGVVTIAWGVYAVVLLIIALRYQFARVRTVALATLFVLVGKLFLIDLEAVETIWRILLFAGFGGLFLLISYFYGSWLGLAEQET